MGINYLTEIAVTAGRCDVLSPGIRRVVAANSGPFTFTGTGTYIVGRGSVAVIDPGPYSVSHIEAIMAALDPAESISHILVTHTHSDHSPGTRILQQHCDAPSYGFGPHGTAGMNVSTQAWLFNDPEADVWAASGGTPKEGADTKFVPDVLLKDGDRVIGDDWEIEALHTPGHTSNHLCFALAGEQVLFTGDHVMGWSTSVIVPPDGNMTDYLASLEKLLQRGEIRYWPTHGPCIDDPQDFVRSFIEHRESRFGAILAGLDAGPARVVELVPSLYADVAKTLWAPAAASTYAALLHLVATGRVTCGDERPSGQSLFELMPDP